LRFAGLTGVRHSRASGDTGRIPFADARRRYGSASPALADD
jgi:hypothetical protein